MKKLLIAFLSTSLLAGLAAHAKPQVEQGPFKLGVQAAHASLSDDSRTLYAKKKTSKKKGAKSKKIKKSEKEKETSNEN